MVPDALGVSTHLAMPVDSASLCTLYVARPVSKGVVVGGISG